MGLLAKFAKRWASSGSKANPDTAVVNKTITGMEDDDQFPMEWYNWQNDRVEQQLDRLVLRNPGPASPGLTRDQLVQGRFSAAGQDGRSWGNMFDAVNTLSYGTIGIRAVDIYYPADDPDTATYEAPRLLVLDSSNNKILEYNTGDQSTRDSGALGDLPTGGGQLWAPTTMHSDNTFVYVMFADTVTNAKRMQCYQLSDWTKASGWPATGIAIGTGTLPYGGDRIITIDDTYICAIDSDRVITAASTAAVYLIQKSDGTITDSGAGDSPTGLSLKAFSGLASDGTNVYFSVFDGTVSGKLCSASLANLQTGSGGTGYPLSPVAANGSYSPDIIFDGSRIISCWFPQNMSSNFLIISTAAKAAAGSYRIQSSELASFHSFNMGFDGRHLWIRADDTGVSGKPIVYRVNLGGLSEHIGAEYLDKYIDKIYAFDQALTYTTAQSQKFIKFDGSSIWALSYGFGGGTRYIRRIPNVTGV
jgi:hypothetical protein